MVKKVAILYGGPSLEHEISVLTALQAIGALDPLKYTLCPLYLTPQGRWFTGDALYDKAFYRTQDLTQLKEVILLPDSGFLEKQSKKPLNIDVCLLAFHGSGGEDGSVQGMLELANVPYTGCTPLAAALSMNKAHAKTCVQALDIAVLPHLLVSKKEAIQDFSKTCQKIMDILPFPLFVKPNSLGSSFGISAAKNQEALEQALATVFQKDTHALVEPLVSPLLEINISVLEPGIASVVEIPIASQESILTFQDKYLSGGNKNESGGMASLTRVIDPQDLEEAIKAQVTNHALKIFDALHLAGVVRFDFMLNPETGALYFNEMNTIPGSFSYYLWEKSHPKRLFPDLLDHIIALAEMRHEEKMGLARDTQWVCV